jgi:hypothetical protein
MPGARSSIADNILGPSVCERTEIRGGGSQEAGLRPVYAYQGRRSTTPKDTWSTI